jgi:rSAM/selenodomain-associated transferase 2
MNEPHQITNEPALSIVIPTIDEAATLPHLLGQLQNQQAVRMEVIVADGGSTDSTRSIAREMGARIVQTAPGRGRQMNRAVAACNGKWLLFLHADSRLTDTRQLASALEALQQRIQSQGNDRVAGHFRLRFSQQEGGRRRAYRYYEKKSELNRPECTNGDQGFLLSHRFFLQLGGFDESLWFLEDQRLAEKIRSQGTWITLSGEIITSARRFEQEGMLRRMILSALIMNFHSIGLDEFFQRAGSVYRNQTETGRLCMSPIFRLIRELNREAGMAEALRRWQATGRYVCSHAWQPFFWLDVTLQPLLGRRRPFLWLHDRLLQPVIGLPPFTTVSAALTWIWFRLSGLTFRLLEQGCLRQPPTAH